MTEVKIYPLMRDVIKTIQKHIPTEYHGSIQFKVDFRGGEPYRVTDVWGTQTLDVEKLK